MGAARGRVICESENRAEIAGSAAPNFGHDEGQPRLSYAAIAEFAGEAPSATYYGAVDYPDRALRIVEEHS